MPANSDEHLNKAADVLREARAQALKAARAASFKNWMMGKTGADEAEAAVYSIEDGRVVCTCTLEDLIASGCQCGAIEKEREETDE